MPHVYLEIETVCVKMWNCIEELCLWGGTVHLLHQNYIICSLSTEDLSPTKPSSFSLQEDEGTQENRATCRCSTHRIISTRLKPTNSSMLPADVAGEEITSSKVVEKDLYSHIALKHVPESNATSRQQWIDLQKFSTLISCYVTLCNKNVRGSNRSHRMPATH